MYIDRTQAPEAKKISHFELLKAQTIHLPNGIPITILGEGTQPIIHLQVVFDAGKWHEHAKGQASFMDKMIGEGTSTMSSEQVSGHFEAYGAFWQANTGTDWTTVECFCLAKHLHLLLPVFNEILLDAAFPEEEWETNRTILQQQLKVSQQKTSYNASMTFKQKLFGEHHPYGYKNTEESISALSIESLQSFYTKHIQQGKPRIFVAGQVSDAHVKLIADTFGSWEVKSQESVAIDHEYTTSPGQFYEEKEDAVQSSIRIGKPLFLRNHIDQVPFQVLNTILGGYFGSRLMQNIREDKGLSYGIYSNVSFMKNASFFFVSADVEKSNCDLAISEIYHEMNQLKKELVDEQELNRVKNYICGSLIKSIDSPLAVANCHKAIELYQLHKKYYDLYTSQIWQVSAQHLRTLANRYFTENWVQVANG